jgi:glycerol transport system permease protein
MTRKAWSHALHPVPDAADLLARQHEFKTTNEILGGFTLFPQTWTLDNYIDDLHRSDLVHGLHQLDHLCGDQHGDLGAGGAAGGLCLLALPLSGRQAPVLLAADQPDGAGRGLRAAVLPALFGGRPVRHALWPWRWRTACSTCRWRSGSWKASCPACRRNSTRPPMSTAIRSRVLRQDLPADDPSGIGVAAFFCFMFSWVELLLSKTLTAVEAKPIAAVMTRTAVMSLGICLGYGHHTRRTRGCWRPAGTLTDHPGAPS